MKTRSAGRAEHGQVERSHADQAERGQILALFTIALVAIVAMVGLVIDGGDAFLQRRQMQNVADAAAMAAGYSFAVTANEATAEAAGVANAATNGYSVAANGATVSVDVTPAVNGSNIVATVSRPHRNWFAGVVGMPWWDVTVTASVVTGVPNGVYGLMPIIVNEDAFTSLAPGQEVVFDEPEVGSNDIPQDATTFNWTNYCTASGEACNADSTTVNTLIREEGAQLEVTLDDNINPLNAGSHTTLFSSLAGAIGTEFPIAVVNDEGELQGWAYFTLTGSVGGSTKQISGFFTPANEAQFTIRTDVPAPTLMTGAYVVKLVN